MLTACTGGERQNTISSYVFKQSVNAFFLILNKND